MMRVAVDTERCVGGGQCVLAAPDIFDQNEDDGTVVLLDPAPPQESATEVQQAQQLCPALAITVVDEAATEPGAGEPAGDQS